MEIFYQCYGAEAGLAGLKWLPYGGLYLTGANLLSCLRDMMHLTIIITI
jgi:glucokinase